MILAINKETGTEITFDTEQQFEMAQTWGSFEKKEAKHEPKEVIKLETALKKVVTVEKVAMKEVVKEKPIETVFIKDEPKEIKKKGRPAKK
jgi:hypothetical protein